MPFLLERLATPSLSNSQPPFFDLAAAVGEQIQRIVSARILETDDGALSLLEFGMPNVVDLSPNSKTELGRYGARLQQLIEHYEPRLLHPNVAVEQGGNALTPYRLVVSGTLMPGGDTHTFHFELPEH